jgi:hypothetical protein
MLHPADLGEVFTSSTIEIISRSWLAVVPRVRDEGGYNA